MNPFNECLRCKKESSNYEERYDYLLERLSEYKKIWVLLFNHEWAIMEEKNGEFYILIWPESEFAKINIKKEWGKYIEKSMDLSYFIDELSPVLIKRNAIIYAFLKPDGSCKKLSINDFLLDLEKRK